MAGQHQKERNMAFDLEQAIFEINKNLSALITDVAWLKEANANNVQAKKDRRSNLIWIASILSGILLPFLIGLTTFALRETHKVDLLCIVNKTQLQQLEPTSFNKK